MNTNSAENFLQYSHGYDFSYRQFYGVKVKVFRSGLSLLAT